MAERKAIAKDSEFESLTVIGPCDPFLDERGYPVYAYLCRCKCGKVIPVKATRLRCHKTTSCGCETASKISKRFTTHGNTRNREFTGTYSSWAAMMTRCTNRKQESFSNYGGRGIEVCERWKAFDNFLADMGPRPQGRYSIERKDVNLGYSPDNCVWATATEQVRNRRITKLVTVDGVEMPLIEACEKHGIPYYPVSQRINILGWDVERALKTPVRPQAKHKPDAKSRTGVVDDR